MNDKQTIRNKLKALRSGFDNGLRRNADKAIYNHFLGQFGEFESFFIYNSFSSEADTKVIIADLLKAGKRVYLPRVNGGEMVAVPYGEMQTGAFGIEEPKGQAYNGDIDVTVIPLLAVNKRGYRTGYGKGYYDRYLKNANTLKVGLGYSFQIAEFDEDEWDIPLDKFVCETGVIDYPDGR